MVHKIDPREVLIYLNELGYTNINGQQLKEFIIDLKKLIKYDLPKYKSTTTENTNPSYIHTNCNESSHNYYPYNESKEQEKTNKDPFNFLYNQATLASKAKEVPRKEKQISVHITKKKSCIDHNHCVHLPKSSGANETEADRLQFVKHTNINISEGSTTEITESTIKSIRPDSKESLESKPSSSKNKEPKSKVACNFIRCKSSKPMVNKCDPVALFHHYQSEWKKAKIPGQDNRADLRWAIREKMLKGPKVELRRSASCRKICSSHRG